MSKVLVAGIGNIFLADDGFGVEVVRRLASESLPPGVDVADFGIRGVHLAYELLEGRYDTTILVDAAPRGGEAGTVYLIEPDLECSAPELQGASVDAHGMQPEAVFAMLKTLGGVPGRVLIVGCEPAVIEERIGLSEAVGRAVDDAVNLIRRVVQDGAPSA